MIKNYDKVRIGMAMSGWPFPKNNPSQLADYVIEMERLDIRNFHLRNRRSNVVCRCPYREIKIRYQRDRFAIEKPYDSRKRDCYIRLSIQR